MEIDSKNAPKKDQGLLLEELKDLEGYIDDLWLFLPIPVCFVNTAFKILNVSKALEDATGYKGLEIIGEGLEKILKNYRELPKELLQREAVIGKEGTLITKEKKNLLTSISAKARKDEDDDILGYFFAFVDLSEIKNKEEELKKKIKELENFQKVAIGRELKMVTLKKEIKKLKKELRQRSH